MDSDEAVDLLSGLMAGELPRRPAWVTALVAKEAKSRVMYPSSSALVQAVISGIIHCDSSSLWTELGDMLSSVETMVSSEMVSASWDQDLQDELSMLSHSVGEMRNLVTAGRLLAKRGVGMSCRAIKDSDAEVASKVFCEIIEQSTSSSQRERWNDKDWTNLWLDLKEIQACGFPFHSSQSVKRQYCSALLRAGRTSLARSHLYGTGSAPLSAQDAQAVILEVAAELLSSANSLDHVNIDMARDCLHLCPESQAAQSELGVIAALERLHALGVTLLPSHLKQMNDKMGVIQQVLEAGRDIAFHRQLGQLLELAEMLGAGSEEEGLQLRLLAALEAQRSSDTPTAARLALDMVSAGYAPSWPLAADIAMSCRGGKGGQALVPATSCRQMLAFACAHCAPERLGPLLEALSACEEEEHAPDMSLRVEACPEYHLTRALATVDIQPSAGDVSRAALPSLGDVPLALSVLMASSDVKRVAMIGTHFHAMQAVFPQAFDALSEQQQQWCRSTKRNGSAGGAMTEGGPASSPVGARQTHIPLSRRALIEMGSQQLLEKVIPGADASQFYGGDSDYQKQVIMQQASLAGRQTAQDPAPDSSDVATRGSQLLQESLALGKSYTCVEAWEIRLQFLTSLLGAGLGTDKVLSTVAGRIVKLRDLLDKAAGALQGIPLRTILTPLLRHMLTPAKLAQPPSSILAEAEPAGGSLLPPLSNESDATSAQSSDPQLAALVTEAQAALYKAVNHGNVLQASKLIKALQVIFAPTYAGEESKPASGKATARTPLSQLPPTLPNLCFVVKLTSTRLGAEGALSQ
eukprot:gene21355-28291_t